MLSKPAVGLLAVMLAVPACDGGSTERSPAPGCADGTREGLKDAGVFAAIAACAGSWTGDVATAGALCASGWHVCTGEEPALKALTFEIASGFAGCFPFNAANDNDTCHPGCTAAVEAGVDSATGIDLAAVGKDCAFRFDAAHGASCLASGRIDGSENTGTGCNATDGYTGVVCCAN